MSVLKLGKLPPRHDARTLQFSKYTHELPPAPPACSWVATMGALGDMLNSELGDCVVAGYAHHVQAWTGADEDPVIIDDAKIRDKYFAMTGGPDSGLVMLDACKVWRKEGLDGHKIDSFVSVRPMDTKDVQHAVYLFGGLYAGVTLYTADMDAFWQGEKWDAPAEGYQEGGHAIPIVGYDPAGLVCITWGKPQVMTWAWFRSHADESYALLAESAWTGRDKVSPAGFDLDALRKDLAFL